MKRALDKIKGRLPAKADGNGKPPAPRKLRPSGEACLNCGAPLYSTYCAVCGQRHYKGRNPYWEFLEDVTDQIVSSESKLWRTLAHMLFVPGRMTRNYIKGMRASYVPPIRLYLVSLVLFFAAVAAFDVAIFKVSMIARESVFTEDDRAAALAEIDGRIARAGEQGREPKFVEVLKGVRAEIEARPATPDSGLFAATGTRFKYVPDLAMFVPIRAGEGAEVTEEMVDDFFEVAALETGAGPVRDFFRRVQNGFVRAAADPRTLNNSLNIWMPRVLIFFVPMFGLFLRFFYWRRDNLMLNQMVFSLHFHTALFFYLTLFVATESAFGSVGEETGMTLFTYGFPLFLLASLKNAFPDGWLKTLAKFAVIWVFYLVGLTIMLAGVFLWGLAEV